VNRRVEKRTRRSPSNSIHLEFGKDKRGTREERKGRGLTAHGWWGAVGKKRGEKYGVELALIPYQLGVEKRKWASPKYSWAQQKRQPECAEIGTARLKIGRVQKMTKGTEREIGMGIPPHEWRELG